MAKTKKTRRDRNPSEAYKHLSPHNPRDLGTTLNHDQTSIPASNFRTLDQTIPSSSLRRSAEYKYTPTGRMNVTLTGERMDLMTHARQSIADGKFRTVTSGHRQHYEFDEEQKNRKEQGKAGLAPMASSPLGGVVRRKSRY